MSNIPKAPDVLLGLCTLTDGTSKQPLTDEKREEIASANKNLASQALRACGSYKNMG